MSNIEERSSLISIIIPTFNRAHLIGETLDSIRQQTYENWECIVVDDGSNDDTSEIMKVYCDRDSRIKYFQRPDSYKSGGSGARNFGLSISRGEYINWFDSDDIMFPEKLETDIKCIESGDFDFTISHSGFIGEKVKKEYWNRNLWSENPLNDFITKKIGWGINSPLWKKKVLLNYNLKFDERLNSGQDFFFHLHAIRNGLKPGLIDTYLVNQRQHSDKIENRVDKSKSKAFIFNYLIQNSEKLKINPETKRYIVESSIYIVLMLYKAKNWTQALYFSKELTKFEIHSKDYYRLMRLFIFGTIFCFSSKGYKFLK